MVIVIATTPKIESLHLPTTDKPGQSKDILSGEQRILLQGRGRQ